MTTVWLTTVRRDYEGDETLAVCSTREKALLAFRDRCADPDRPDRMDCSHDRHFVERWTVDGAAEAEEVFSNTIEDAWAARRDGEG
jgi:hypothetical protein